jgi:PAS domain S-box-containing protein
VRTPIARLLILGAAIALAYLAGAHLGFRLAFVAEQVTTVWAPTGIALSALLLGGVRLWPAIWLGAFAANASTAAPLWTAFIVATGNTLEAVAAAWALRQIPAFDAALRRARDVLAFIAIAGLACTAISATIGVVTLCAAGVQSWARFGELWFDWWLGDALGAIIVAPAILTTIGHTWSRRESAIAAAFAGTALIVIHVVFGQVLGLSPHPLEYAIFPVVIAAAVVGSPAVTSLTVLSASALAVWHTVHTSGPFAGAQVHQSLILLQAFMGVLSGTALLLAASIAERRDTEKRERDAARDLRHRDDMLRLAQRAGGVATFEWNYRDQMALCSPEFFTIFGLPERDGSMSAEEWGRFVHPDDRERMAAHLARAIAGTEPAVADYRINAADGTTRWLSYAGQIQRTGAGERLLGTVVDITDRKRLEDELRHHAAEVERILETRLAAVAALRESRDVLSLAMRGGAMGAWSRNFVTDEVWWSPELEEIVGLQPGTFSRTETAFFDLVHEDDRGSVRTAIDEGVARGSDYIVEFRFKHASGEWRWMEGRGRAVYDADGTPRTLYGIGIDATERKRDEMALREAKSAAESANELKDQFLATLSHELRTPLNVILGYARLLQNHAVPPQEQQRAFDVIARNAVAQNQLVDDLLDMSRITTGKFRLEPRPVLVAVVLGEALEGVKPAADAKGIALAVDVDPGTATVMADPTRLQQVFWNLLTNSVKFTPKGGRISVSLQRDGGSALISIGDTGAGIPPEFLPFVFEPFRQAGAGFDRAHGGLGLGLAISRQLVELHGGTIQAVSLGLGQGATFTVSLPRVSDSDEVADGATARLDEVNDAARTVSDASLAGVNILLVDDEPDTLTMFREALEKAGARVRAAGSGPEALRVLEDWQPDLLVTDLGLPGMDGYELFRAVRLKRSGRAFPAVAVSAYARLDDRDRALAAGFIAHVSKPIDPLSLVRLLSSLSAHE